MIGERAKSVNLMVIDSEVWRRSARVHTKSGRSTCRQTAPHSCTHATNTLIEGSMEDKPVGDRFARC